MGSPENMEFKACYGGELRYNSPNGCGENHPPPRDGPGSIGFGYSDATEVARKLVELFEGKEFDVCTVVYNEFKTAMTQVVTFQQLIPFSPNTSADGINLDGAIYELELPIPTLNTILLLVSSATFHKAGKALLKDKNSDSQKWLFFTAFLGIIFLICQLFEYFHLPFGLTDNLFASTFYALTGFHGLHVTLGTLMILIIAWQSRINGGRLTSQNMFPLEAVELYWHFVDGIWVILFIILYLL